MVGKTSKTRELFLEKATRYVTVILSKKVAYDKKHFQGQRAYLLMDDSA